MNPILSVVPPSALPPDAIGRELALHENYLRGLAHRGLAADLAAKVGVSDVVQDTFFAASRDIASYRGKSSREFRGWLEAILRHRLQYLRRHFRTSARRQVGRELPLGGPGEPAAGLMAGNIAAPPTPSPLSRVVQAEQAAALRQAVGQLSEGDACLVRWHQQDRLSFNEIGTRLGISEDAARKRWARALKRLRDLLGPVDESR